MKTALFGLILVLACHDLANAQLEEADPELSEPFPYLSDETPPSRCPLGLIWCKWHRACCPPRLCISDFV